MSDRPEISQDLARRAIEECRQSMMTGCSDGRAKIVAEYDALEQPTDPALDGARNIRAEVMNRVHQGLSAPSSDDLADFNRQAYAEREKAVKEFWTEHNCLAKNDGCLICQKVRIFYQEWKK